MPVHTLTGLAGAVLGFLVALGVMVGVEKLEQPSKGTEQLPSAVTDHFDAVTSESVAALQGWSYPKVYGNKSYVGPTVGNEREDCGTWQKGYANLHAAILAGHAPQRFAVQYCDRGLADCLKGAVSVMYYALLTGRAFQMYLPGGNQYEWAFDQPNINWTATHATHKFDRRHTKFFDITKKRKVRFRKLFVNTDIRLLAAEYDTVHFNSGWGTTMLLIENPHHRAQLYNMGFRPETMFGCAMDFLVRPNAELRRMFEPELQALLQPHTLMIGIQIRIPFDTMFDGRDVDNFTTAEYSSFFDCAKEIDAARRRQGQDVRWYFISDSMHLRRLAKREYGEKLLTSIETVHVRHIARRTDPDNLYMPFMSAAGEMWLFSLVDFHVISMHSGYGTAAALWSRRWHNVYQVDNIENNKMSCGAEDYERQLLLLF